MVPIDSKIFQKWNIINEQDPVINLICKYCSNNYSNKGNLNKHLKSCKIKNSIENELIKEEIYQTLLKEVKELRNEIKSIKTHKSTIKDNTINTNIQVTNISLVPFGDEDLSCITNDVCKKLFMKGFTSVPHLINQIHFNQKRPELSNIYISNMRDKYIMVFDGINWALRERDDTITTLYDHKKEFLIEKFDELVDELSNTTIKKFQRFLDHEEDDSVINRIKKDIKLLLYNNRKIPMSIRKMFECDIKLIE
jgi:hypothetical protein